MLGNADLVHGTETSISSREGGFPHRTLRALILLTSTATDNGAIELRRSPQLLQLL